MGSYVTLDDKGKVEIHSGPAKMPAGTRFVIGPDVNIVLPQEPALPLEIRAARLASLNPKKGSHVNL